MQNNEREELQELLRDNWGDLSNYTFDQSGARLFGTFDKLRMFLGALDHALSQDDTKVVLTLMLAGLQVAYNKGRESATQ